MKVVFLITLKTDRVDELLDAWHDLGVGGATVVLSGGRSAPVPGGAPEDLPAFGTVSGYLDARERPSVTIVGVMPDELVEPAIGKVREIIGDLSRPSMGILFVFNAEAVVGYRPVAR